MRDGDGVCPVCNGSGRKPADEEMKKYANVIAGYDKLLVTNDPEKLTDPKA